MGNLLRSLAFLAIASAIFGIGATSASAVTWTLPAADLTSGVRPTYLPQIAIAPDGATTVVWRRFDGTRDIIQAATRPAGSDTFGAPQDLSAGQDEESPRVAVAPDGATTVVWENDDGAELVIQAATRPAGSSSFGAPQPLSATGGNALEPQVTVAPDGATTVVWRRFDGTNLIVQARTRPAGSSSFGPPLDLSGRFLNAYEPQVAIAPDGATTVVWRSDNGADQIIKAATRPAGSSSFGAPQDLSVGGESAYGPQVAVAPDGATTVVWENDDGADRIIQAATRPAGSSSFGPPQDLSATGGNAESPQIAIAADGATTVVWSRSDAPSPAIVQASSRAAGAAAWSAPVALAESASVLRDPLPAIAAADDGAFTATWELGGIVQAATAPPVYQLSVSKSGNGDGTVTSTPAGIDCGSTCQAGFRNGASVTLNAAATSGSTFTGWSGSGCSGAGTCTVTMSEARSVTASFTEQAIIREPTVKVLSAKAKVSKRSVLITSRVKVSGQGRISQRATTGKGKRAKTWCKASKKAGAATTYTVTCRIGIKGRKALRKKALKLTLRTTFTPAGAKALTTNRKLTIKRRR